MKIIIPMAGKGFRFINQGYQVPKPLIEIDGKPMIEHIVNMFPQETDFVFICNQEHLATTNLKNVLEKIAPQGKIVSIESHTFGPVYSVLQAKHLIADQEPVIVNYCDCAVFWDYEKFKKEMQETQCQACAVGFKGFHPPHATRPDVHYAYMKENNGDLLEIREKIPFTNDKTAEYAGSGMHYFSKGKHLKDYCQKLMDKELHHNGEYYVSLVNNLLVEDGLKVKIHEASTFLSWGTPQELEEYNFWSAYFIKEFLFKPTKKFEGQVLVPMAGEGSRFKKEGYVDPKPFVKVGELPMIVEAVRTMPLSEKYIFVHQEKHVSGDLLKETLNKHLGISPEIVSLQGPTQGGAETCLKAENKLDPQKPIFIFACDQSLVFNEQKLADLTADTSIDCLVITFRNYPGANYNPTAYSWVEQENGLVKRISLKNPVSSNPRQDPCIVGAFWFRKAGDFLQAAKDFLASPKPQAGEYHLEGVVDYLLKMGKKAVVFDVDRFICFGAPNDLKTYLYWKDYFSKAKLIQTA